MIPIGVFPWLVMGLQQLPVKYEVASSGWRCYAGAGSVGDADRDKAEFEKDEAIGTSASKTGHAYDD